MNSLRILLRQLDTTVLTSKCILLKDVYRQTFFTSSVCCRIKLDEDARHMSLQYMDSAAYSACYKNIPVWKLYRRNFLGQKPPPPRRTCIRKGKYATGNPCPVCRDEFLVLDYRNVKLLQQFVDQATNKPIPNSMTGLCQEQQRNLVDEVLKAQELGYMLTYVPVKKYDYELFHKIAKRALLDEERKNELKSTSSTETEREES